MKAANLTVRFLLDLCLLAALAYDGLQLNAALAVVAPAVAAIVWALFVSPRARFPLGSVVLFWHQADTDMSHLRP